MFNRPTTLDIRLDDIDGEIVALKKIGDGGLVKRTMDDGRVVSRRPILADVLTYIDGVATRHTTLVFPPSLTQVLEAKPGEYVFGRLNKEDHPSKANWHLWQFEDLDDATAQEAEAAFYELVS